jgi:hypothetical protein
MEIIDGKIVFTNGEMTALLIAMGSKGLVISSTFYADDGKLHNFEVEEAE